MIGNAVSAPVVATIAGSIMCALEHKSGCRLAGLRAGLSTVLLACPPGGSGGGEEGEDMQGRHVLLARAVKLPGEGSVPLRELCESVGVECEVGRVPSCTTPLGFKQRRAWRRLLCGTFTVLVLRFAFDRS